MFKQHPVYEGYSCNTLGNIKGPSGRILKQRLSNAKAKTYSVLVKHQGKTLTVQAKVFVYETWKGPIGSATVFCKDNDESNTGLENLILTTDLEDWKPHPVYSEYKASANGKILGKTGKPVNPVLCKDTGYMRITLKDSENKSIPKLAHRFIFECVAGELIPEGLTINHIDGNKQNNLVENLEAVTQAENNIHAKETGLNKQFLDTAYQAKLTNEEVISIKHRISKGETVASIFKDFSDKVSIWSLYRIKQNKNWTRI